MQGWPFEAAPTSLAVYQEQFVGSFDQGSGPVEGSPRQWALAERLEPVFVIVPALVLALVLEPALELELGHGLFDVGGAPCKPRVVAE